MVASAAEHTQGPEHERADATQGAEHERDHGEIAVLDAEQRDGGAQAVKQPAHGRRGSAPGPRGCWAVKADGEPCAAPRAARLDSDYCSAHTGESGVAANPALWAGRGGQAHAERSRQRAALRLALGVDRSYGPRAALRAASALRAGEVAGRAVGAILDPKVDPVRAAELALRLIDAVDPLSTVSIETVLPDDPHALQGMSLTDLQSLALGQGLVDSPA